MYKNIYENKKKASISKIEDFGNFIIAFIVHVRLK